MFSTNSTIFFSWINNLFKALFMINMKFTALELNNLTFLFKFIQANWTISGLLKWQSWFSDLGIYQEILYRIILIIDSYFWNTYKLIIILINILIINIHKWTIYISLSEDSVTISIEIFISINIIRLWRPLYKIVYNMYQVR